MTHPKKWHLQLADKGTDNQKPSDVGACQNMVLVNSEGLMKKPNAWEPPWKCGKCKFCLILRMHLHCKDIGYLRKVAPTLILFRGA